VRNLVVLSAKWHKIGRVIVGLKSKADFVVDFLGRFSASMDGTLCTVFFVQKITDILFVVGS